MIAKKLFSVHSPIWQLFFSAAGILLTTMLYAIFVMQNFHLSIVTIEQGPAGQTTTVSINPWIATGVVLGLGTLIAYSIVCSRHNKMSKNKVRPFSFKPNEIIGDDERVWQASANASLKLYAQNHIVFPFVALALIFAMGSGGVLMLAIVMLAFVTMYYLTYLKAMWPYLGEE